MENLFGLYKDNLPINAPITYKTWEHAKNIFVDYKEIKTEKGFVLRHSLEGEVICALPLAESYLVITTNNVNNSIYLIEKDVVTPVFENVDFGFTSNHPIEAVYTYNDCQELIVVLTDFNVSIKKLNVTKIINENPAFNKFDYELFPIMPFADVKVTVENSGNVKTGTYSFFYSLIDAFDIITKTNSFTEVVYVYSDNFEERLEFIQGDLEPINSNKSIRLNFDINDSNYIKLKLGYLHTSNGITRAYYLNNDYPLNTNVFDIVFLGNELVTEVDVSKVLIDNFKFETAKTITFLNNNFYAANLKVKDYSYFQKYVNNFKLEYVAKIIKPAERDSSSKFVDYNKSFMPREVYSFYFWFKTVKGVVSPNFHIPGLELTAQDLAPSTLDTDLPAAPSKYEVEDTITNVSVNGLRGNMGKWQNKNETYAANEFSEIYDSNNNLVGTLTGNVRHHRFPSLRFLRDNVSQGTFLGFQDDIVLGVRLKDIHFPPELDNEIISYGISYAKRDVNNMTVYGQDLLLHSLELFDHTTLTGTAQTVYDPSIATKSGIAAKHTTAGANINRTLSFRTQGGSRVFYKVNQEIGRGHNPDIQLDKPSIQPDYIANEIFLKLEYEDEGFKHHTELENHDSEAVIDFNQAAAETVLRKRFSLINNTNKIIDLTRNFGTPFISNNLYFGNNSNKIKAIKNFKFIPNDVTFNVNGQVYSNLGCESFFHFEFYNKTPKFAVDNENLSISSVELAGVPTLDAAEAADTSVYPLNVIGNTYNSVNKINRNHSVASHLALHRRNKIKTLYTNRISYCKILPNIYTGYTNQKDLITSKEIMKTGINVDFFCGDVFVSVNTITTHARHDHNLYSVNKANQEFDFDDYINGTNPVEVGANQGTTYFFYITSLHTINNFSLRSQDLSDDLTRFFPKTTSFGKDVGATQTFNDGYSDWKISYNKDYSKLKDYYKNLIFANIQECKDATKPFDIQLGIRAEDFLANDFYSMLNKNHGEIIKILSYKNGLLIHQKNSLYFAQIKDTLVTEVNLVYLGTGDIFDRNPNEIADDIQGYAGNQNQFASILCKHGYVFLDRKQGKIFIFNGQLDEISNKGLHNFFRDNLDYENSEDNPYNNNGYTLMFDETFDRLILSKKYIKFTGTYITTYKDYATLSGLSSFIENTVLLFKGKIYKIKYGFSDLENKTDTFFDINNNPFYGELVLLDENNSLEISETYSYNFSLKENYGGWVAFHDYYPNYLFNTRNQQFALLNENNESFIYEMNVGEIGQYFKEITYPTFVDMIYNLQQNYNKIITNIEWDANVIEDNKVLENETFDEILLYNDNQCSGYVNLKDKNFLKRNAQNNKNTWAFNNFRDLVIDPNIYFIDDKKELNLLNIAENKSFFFRSKFSGKFVIIRFKYNNTENKMLVFNNYKVNININKQ
jgi:hypothetical protein